MSTVVIRELTRKEPDLCGIELENGAGSDKHWQAPNFNKRRKGRKKSRKKRARDLDVTTIDLESGEIEEDMAPLQKDDAVTEGGVSGRGLQQHVDVPEVSV